MKNLARVITHATLPLFIAIGCYPNLGESAALSLGTSPLYITSPVPPIVMLDVSKDHQLYYKAYNDFSDLDGNLVGGDSALETKYKHTFDYYGYFDSYKCYTYSTANARFEPFGITSDKYCTGTNAGKWSGNFLNWVSMSRMDIMRKVLYGGTRSTDTATLTVLERAFLPTDAHSWAKYYNESDIASLTPFNPATTAATGSSTTSVTIGSGSKTFNSSMTGITIGDQILVLNSSSNYMYGVVTAATSGSSFTITVEAGATAGSGTYTSWTITNQSSTGISFCNTTYSVTGQASQSLSTTTYPPLIRVAKGNYALWSANERWQCYWSEEKNNIQSGFAGGIRSNGNRYSRSGLASSAENPSYAANGLLVSGMTGKADYVARVKVCDSTLIGNENCKTYGTSNKPVGLLQNYGEAPASGDSKIHFGLMTGSYSKNVSGGVLRKNVGTLNDEINTATDGTLTSTVGIIKTIDKLRLYGYTYDNGYYNTSDTCNYQQIGIVPSGGTNSGGYPANEGNCSTWGNPMSEIYLESLRYLAGKTATSAFVYGSGSKDSTLGLPLATWTDPVNSTNYCSPLNVVVFNASVSSYDSDQMSGISNLGTSNSAAYYTGKIGDGESITGQTASVGGNGSTYDGLCTGKTISSLGTALGICPEAPSIGGSYLIAGTAYYAHTNKIRSDITIPTANDDYKYLKATTYGIALATNVPRISVTVGSGTVVIQPAYRLDRTDIASGRYGTGTIVDFKIVSQTATSGTFYVNWEDSNQGGDYDQDVWGILSYTISGNTITVTTQVASASTANPQGFGYVISGTTKDGAHFHSGIYNFTYSDPTNVTVSPATNIGTTGGCQGCSDNATDIARSVTYTAGSASGVTLKDPLYYAAKWGGFTDLEADANHAPDSQAKWDSQLTDGTNGSDQIPDTYFYVNNPGALEASLDQAFNRILEESSAASVATNSTSLQTGSQIYQGKFSSRDWHGELVAYPISTSGVIGTRAAWTTADTMATPDANSRVIMTYKPSNGIGIPFRWPVDPATPTSTELDTTQSTAIGSANRLNYLRGDATNEGAGSSQYRKRIASKLGDIVNSNPQYIGAPIGQYEDINLLPQPYIDPLAPSYSTFRATYLDRTKMIYVGANDGMLHGFDAATGNEKIAYVPSKVYTNLASLASQTYSHKYFVDGAPTIADAVVNGAWKTVLVGGLNGGGKGVYALDVTDPSSSSFTEANAASKVLWEFTDSNNSDLGYTFSKPLIVKMNNDKWAAVFGNGYNNTGTGEAVLFVLFLEDGIDRTWGTNDYVKITTKVGSLTTPNGLASVNQIDLNGDGKVDAIYGGDLQGNMWKFDVSDTNKNNWKVAYGTTANPEPLFTACGDATTALTCTNSRQPITTRPVISLHPVYAGTVIVYFGTGKYLESSDISSTQVQAFYGIWDKGTALTLTNYSNLLQQTFSTTTIDITTVVTATDTTTTTTTTTDGVSTTNTTTTATGGTPSTTTTSDTYRGVTNLPISWGTLATPINLGWYENFPAGERHTGTPKLEHGALIYNTFIPSTTACDFGGSGYLMLVNYTNGGLISSAIFDTNRDGIFSALDTNMAGLKIGAALGGTTIIGGGSSGSGGATGRGGIGGGGGSGGVSSSSSSGGSSGGSSSSGGTGTGVTSTTKGGLIGTDLNLPGVSGARVSWRELINQ